MTMFIIAATVVAVAVTAVTSAGLGTTLFSVVVLGSIAYDGLHK